MTAVQENVAVSAGAASGTGPGAACREGLTPTARTRIVDRRCNPDRRPREDAG